MSDSKFQTHPWTEAAVEELFSQNKPFRQAALATARKLFGQETSVTKDEALALVKGVVGLSTKIGDRLSETRVTKKKSMDTGTKKYPHPGYVLWWLRKFKDGDLSDLTPDGTMPGLSSATGAMIFNLIKSVRLPSTMSNAWAKFMKEVNFTGTNNPYFFTTSVHPMPTTGSGSLRGFKLKTLKVRVPKGVQLMNVPSSDKRYSEYVRPQVLRPRTTSVMTIDLTKFDDILGEVWLAISSDGKSVFLASKKACTLKLSEFLNEAIARGAGSFYGDATAAKFTEWPYPGNGFKKEIPGAQKRLLSKKRETQKELKGPFRTAVDIDR